MRQNNICPIKPVYGRIKEIKKAGRGLVVFSVDFTCADMTSYGVAVASYVVAGAHIWDWKRV